MNVDEWIIKNDVSWSFTQFILYLWCFDLSSVSPRLKYQKRWKRVRDINLPNKTPSPTSNWNLIQGTIQKYLNAFSPIFFTEHTLPVNQPNVKKKWTSWSGFTENGYNNNELMKIAKMYHQKMTSRPNNVNQQEDDTLNATVTLPFLS